MTITSSNAEINANLLAPRDGAYEDADVETPMPRDADAPGYTLDDDALGDTGSGVLVENVNETSLGEDYTPASSDLYREEQLDENNDQSEADTGSTVDTTGTGAGLASDGMDQGEGDTTLITTDAPD